MWTSSAKRNRVLQSRRGGKRLRENQDGIEEDDEDMHIAKCGTTSFQDVMWTINNVSDMCLPEDPTIKSVVGDMGYFDENSWERLDQHWVEEGEKKLGSRGERRLLFTHTRVVRRPIL